jgi:hypothetical protein
MFIAPGKFLALQPASGGSLPLGFGGQFFPRPARVGFGILVSHVDHRMLLNTGN